ncbi:hypothetical protein V8C34DRAFT_311946 [Trichoderma compactum]
MPANMPTIADKMGEEVEIVGQNALRTRIRGQDASQLSHPRSNNQELVNPGLVAMAQRIKKRNRGEDEEEDELALPTKYIRMRTSAMPGVENWEAFTLSQLAQRDPEALCDLLDANRAEFKRQRIEMKSLEAEVKQERKTHRETCGRLSSEIKTLKIEMEKLLLQNMDFGTKKASDDTIQSRWWQLTNKIKNIVSNYFTEWPQGEAISVNGTEYDRQAQSIPADHILALRQSIKRRQLWLRLFCNIFSGDSDHFHGKIGGTIARLTSHQEPHNLPNPQYLQMISKIKSILDLDLERETDPESNAELEEMIRVTVAQFKDIVANKKMCEFEGDLRKLFSDAWKIYTAMMTSKAIFIVQWIDEGSGDTHRRYNPETMEFLNSNDTSEALEYVIIVESPILWKIGNGDGENFDSTTVLCKHSVFQGGERIKPGTSIRDISSS